MFTQRHLWFQVDNKGDVVMMMAKLQGSTAKSAAGQEPLTGNRSEFPEDIFRQSEESILIDERHRSD